MQQIKKKSDGVSFNCEYQFCVNFDKGVTLIGRYFWYVIRNGTFKVFSKIHIVGFANIARFFSKLTGLVLSIS